MMHNDRRGGDSGIQILLETHYGIAILVYLVAFTSMSSNIWYAASSEAMIVDLNKCSTAVYSYFQIFPMRNRLNLSIFP